MLAANTLLSFGLICLAMVLTPGPNMIYLISRSQSQGPKAGLISLGGVPGFLCAAWLVERWGRKPTTIASLVWA